MKPVTLYKLTNSNMLTWSVCVSEAKVVVEHGILRGKSQVEVLAYANNYEAEVEARRRIAIKKTKQGYTDEIPSTIPELPMLASTYNPDKLPDKIYIQPKLDGIRCVASCSTMRTRRNEPITSMPHISEALKDLPPGIKLDGELYCHGKSFQDHLSIVKREAIHPEFNKIVYCVFDIQLENVPYAERYSLLFTTIDKLGSNYVIAVKTLAKLKEDVAQTAKTEFFDYEGAILRDPAGLYLYNHRSSALQKYKWTETAECEITNIIAPTTGRSEGAAIFVCRHPDTGKSFKVVPKLPIYIRQAMFRDKSTFIGYWAKVTYEKLSDKGVPLKPRAEAYAHSPEDLQ